MARTKKSLATVASNLKINFQQVIQEEMVKKYANDALKMIEELKKLQKAVAKYEAWIKRLDEGDYTAVEEYKKKRQRLEDEDGYEL